MLPLRSILCPVDFSAHAEHVLRYAAALASLVRARLTVAWVAEPLLAQAAVVSALDPHGEQACADLRKFVAEALALRAPWLPEPQLVLTVGKPEHEILKIAREQRADLIVMGMHGLSGYQKMFFGSTTERVIRLTTTPVLAVPLAGDPQDGEASGRCRRHGDIGPEPLSCPPSALAMRPSTSPAHSSSPRMPSPDTPRRVAVPAPRLAWIAPHRIRSSRS